MDPVEYSQAVKGKMSKILGFVWTSPFEIVFITDCGIELYTVIPDKRTLKNIKVWVESDSNCLKINCHFPPPPPSFYWQRLSLSKRRWSTWAWTGSFSTPTVAFSSCLLEKLETCFIHSSLNNNQSSSCPNSRSSSLPAKELGKRCSRWDFLETSPVCLMLSLSGVSKKTLRLWPSCTMEK